MANTENAKQSVLDELSDFMSEYWEAQNELKWAEERFREAQDRYNELTKEATRYGASQEDILNYT